MLTINIFNLTIDTTLFISNNVLNFYHYLSTKVYQILPNSNNKDCPFSAVTINIVVFKHNFWYGTNRLTIKIRYRPWRGVRRFYYLLQSQSLPINLRYRYRLRGCSQWCTSGLVRNCSGSSGL